MINTNVAGFEEAIPDYSEELLQKIKYRDKKVVSLLKLLMAKI